MASLRVHRDFQQVRRLPFCYLCGLDFVRNDDTDRDHVPPKCTFNPRDRELRILTLKTHRACNSAFKVEDKKIGQLIALRRFEGPNSMRDQALQFVHYPGLGTSVDNVNIEAAVWRWVRGFHAALYGRPLVGASVAIQTPFPRGERGGSSGIAIKPIPKQHVIAVEAIKRNRTSGNLDSIVSNNDKLRYECVWCESDAGGQWICVFALDIYDWKDLGSHTPEIPARGCAGMYGFPDFSAPDNATRDLKQRIAVPNRDILDPFAP